MREDGTLLVEGMAAREGVYEYRTPRGTVRELVTLEALQGDATGLARRVVTLDHPDPTTYPKGVTPENVDKLGVGDTDGEVVVGDGGFTKVKIAVRRKDAIDAIRAGTQELSPGYAVRLDRTPGTHPVHGRYDQRQVGRSYNHLAIVDRARGGREIRLRADSAVATTVISLPGSTGANPSGATPQGATVNPGFLRLLTLLGVTSRVDSDNAAIEACVGALDSKARADQAEAGKLAAEKTRADTEKARADAAEAKLQAFKDAETARVDTAERADLETVAKTLGIDPTQHADGKSLRRAIASKHLGTEVKADESDDYVRAMVDLAKKAGSGKRSDGREAGRAAWTPPAGGGARQDARGSSSAASGRPKSLFAMALARSDSARNGGEA